MTRSITSLSARRVLDSPRTATHGPIPARLVALSTRIASPLSGLMTRAFCVVVVIDGSGVLPCGPASVDEVVQRPVPR
jgi:hypothetical protein